MIKSKKDPRNHNLFSMMKKGAKTKSDSRRLGGGEKWQKKRGKKNWRNLLKPRKNNRKS